MTITTARYPAAPPTTPVRGTLLDAATVSDEYAWLTGVDLFESYSCMKFRTAAALPCNANSKTFDQTSVWQDGIQFAVYGGVVCKAPGLDQANMRKQARLAFTGGESVGVERALMAQRFIANAPQWGAAPTDITPGTGAVKPVTGLAMLEGHAGDNYVGAPTIHVPKVIGSLILLTGLGVEWQGSTLRTKLGSKVAAGAGYDYPNLGPTGAAAPAGEKWLYATGEVWVGMSELMNPPPQVNQSTNEVFVLAERGYIAAVDCYTAAIRVKVDA